MIRTPARTKAPKCPNCNVDLVVAAADFPIDFPILGPVDPAPTLFVCQNSDDVCGFFTIFGRKVQPPEPVELEGVIQ